MLSVAKGGPSPSQHRRYWARFSLRTLLIIFTSIILLLSFWNYWIVKENRAVKQIEQAGGRAWYEHELNLVVPEELESRRTKLVRNLIIKCGFSAVRLIKFPGARTLGVRSVAKHRPIEEKTLKAVSSLSTTTALEFCDIPLRLEGLHYLKSLRELKLLQFHCSSDTQPSDCFALDQLGGMTSLQSLAVTGLPDVRGQLDFLRKLENLRSLEIRAARLGTESLKIIGTLTQLEELLISEISLDESGLTHLADLKELRYLDIGKAPVAPESIVQLEKLKKLRCLVICPTAINDTFIVALKSLSGLRYLDLTCEQFDEQRLQELHAALPDCRITPGSNMTDDFLEEYHGLSEDDDIPEEYLKMINDYSND